MAKVTISVEEYKQLVTTKIKYDSLLDAVLNSAEVNDKDESLNISEWRAGEVSWDIIRYFERERIAAKLAELKEIKKKEVNMAPAEA